MQVAVRAFSRALESAGNSMLAKMAMIAITTSSSIQVNGQLSGCGSLFFIVIRLCGFRVNFADPPILSAKTHVFQMARRWYFVSKSHIRAKVAAAGTACLAEVTLSVAAWMAMGLLR